jgi:hypothetical protein
VTVVTAVTKTMICAELVGRGALERVMNFGQALLAPVAEGEVAVWKGLEHRWVLRAGCG